MNHSFDVDVAIQYGINAAIVFQDMGHWCEHSRINRANFYDGRYWTFNSNKALCEHYPYMSGKAIRSAIQKLVDAGLIVTGNYNKLPFDRTLWYALTNEGERIYQNGNLHLPKKANDKFPKGQMTSSQKGEPIPNTIDSIELYNGHSPMFDDFWNAYPRKVAKQNAIKAWSKAGADDSQSLAETIIADVKRRVEGEWKEREERYIPHPTTYLNQRRWEDEIPEPELEKRGGLYYENLSPAEFNRLQEEAAERDREEARRQGLI